MLFGQQTFTQIVREQQSVQKLLTEHRLMRWTLAAARRLAGAVTLDRCQQHAYLRHIAAKDRGDHLVILLLGQP
jgi:hypothetical protein